METSSKLAKTSLNQSHATLPSPHFQRQATGGGPSSSPARKTGKPSSPVKTPKFIIKHNLDIVRDILTIAGLEGIRGRTGVVTVAGTKGRLSTQIMQYKDVPHQWYINGCRRTLICGKIVMEYAKY